MFLACTWLIVGLVAPDPARIPVLEYMASHVYLAAAVDLETQRGGEGAVSL